MSDATTDVPRSVNLTVAVTVNVDVDGIPLDEDGRPDQESMAQLVEAELAGARFFDWRMGDWSVRP